MYIFYKCISHYRNVLMLFLFCMPALHAKCQLELVSQSYPFAPFGPTVASQTATFFRNTSGSTFEPYTPTLTVTASLSNQQYTSQPELSTGTGICFGANIGGTTVSSELSFLPMNSVGGGVNNQFTAALTQPAGTGIDVLINNAFSIFAVVQPLIGQPLNGRFLYGTLTLTFNRPVNNPIIHFVGLGSNFSSDIVSHGAAAEFELQTPGVGLSRLSGSTEFTVASNKVLNNASIIGPLCGTGAGCGSLEAIGTNITSLAFNIYLRGDGMGTDWSAAGYSTGDKFMIGVSLDDPGTAPITGLNLTAFHSADNAYLQWITFTEQNTNYFSVERSTNGVDFIEVGRVKAGGNRNSISNYAFNDLNPQPAIVYYRVTVIDYDGKRTNSNIVLLQLNEKNTDIKIFPNPAFNNIYIESNTKGGYQFDLFNAQGQKMLSKKILTDGSTISSMERNSLPNGIYLLRVNNAATGQIKNFKLVLQ